MTEFTITTERLGLRPFQQTDALRVRELAGVWDVARMLSPIPHPYPDGAAEAWIATHEQTRAEGSDYPFAITRHDKCIGSIGVGHSKERGAGDGTFVFGYWLGMPYWGQGLATEAANAIVTFAFARLNKDRLLSDYFIDNPASGRVLAKTGFTEIGRGSMYSLARGHSSDAIFMALTRDSWAAKQV